MLDEKVFVAPQQGPENTKQPKKSKLTKSDRIAFYLTSKIGSMAMLYCLTAIILAWLIVSECILKRYAFDPYPLYFSHHS